ncbi:MAG TPA: hypothetical protein EYH05_00380 [Anaerolineae bacterium]|nr:hypothetical protein [Anaerolineae bacterium]
MINRIRKTIGIRRKFLLLASTLLMLSVGCQPTTNDSVIGSTKIGNSNSIMTPTIQTRIASTEIRETTGHVGATRSPSPIPVLDNATSQPIEIETPTSSAPTATGINPDILEFDTQIAFLGQYQEDDNYLIGVLDVATSDLKIIADDKDVEFGTPMWDPDKDRLAFTRSDSITVSLQISDLIDSTQVFLNIGKSFEQKNNDNGIPFLFGWSGDAEWLAYALIYPTTKQNLYLVNVQTKENVLINNPNSIWFSWSSRGGTFVFTDSNALYIGNVESPNDLEVHQGRGYISLMNWHPSKNILLVGIGTNIAGDINQLWKLNTDSGEWFRIGEYPEIAHFKYAPNGEFIAIHLQDRIQGLNRLLIVEDETGSIMYEIELPENSFFDLEWIDDVTIGLTARDNVYIVSTKAPSLSYWALGSENFVNERTFLIHSIDW